MKTLDRYLLQSFLVNYFLSLFVLISLYVVLDLFVNLDEFTAVVLLATVRGHHVVCRLRDAGAAAAAE